VAKNANQDGTLLVETTNDSKDYHTVNAAERAII
jgi:hypothetical protein